jgi:hypothetical protein
MESRPKLVELFKLEVLELSRLHEMCARGNTARADNLFQSAIRDMGVVRGSKFTAVPGEATALQFRDFSRITLQVHFPASLCALIHRAIEPAPKVDARRIIGLNGPRRGTFHAQGRAA